MKNEIELERRDDRPSGTTLGVITWLALTVIAGALTMMWWGLS